MTNTFRIRLAAAATAGVLLAGAALGQYRFGYEEKTGEELYTHVCQGCHMADGKGAIGAGAYPALAGDVKLKAAAYPALVVVRGQKAMPAFADMTDEQVANVVNYVRTHFGNAYTDAVTPAQVKALRPKGGDAAHFSAG